MIQDNDLLKEKKALIKEINEMITREGALDKELLQQLSDRLDYLIWETMKKNELTNG